MQNIFFVVTFNNIFVFVLLIFLICDLSKTKILLNVVSDIIKIIYRNIRIIYNLIKLITFKRSSEVLLLTCKNKYCVLIVSGKNNFK